MPLKYSEARKAYKAAYYQKNRERLMAEQALRRSEHGEKIRLAQKQARYARPARYLLFHVRARAKKLGLPFNLTEADLAIPERCPVLGIPLTLGRVKLAPGSPTADRIVPELGYVAGNVRVISWRANCLKRDATPEELLAVANYAIQESVRVRKTLI